MSKHETRMTRWYWEQVGGTLIKEFPAIKSSSGTGRRFLDALIIKGAEKSIRQPHEISVENQDVVIVQAKNSRLGMSLMGQTLFSIELIRPLKPKSIESVALCTRTDAILEPLLLKFPECRVVVYSGYL